MKQKFLELMKKIRIGDGATGLKAAGFTMIELLIVIAILGILAVAVLSAINPVEQINRGRDTGSRSDAEQLLSAIDRFNAFQGYYPWQNGASDQTYSLPFQIWSQATGVAPGLEQNTTGCGVSDLLSAGSTTPACTGSNELKVTFFSRIFDSGYNYLNIYHGANASDSTYICFTPKSDAFNTEAKTRCGVNGAGLPADLLSEAATICDDTNDVYMVCLP